MTTKERVKIGIIGAGKMGSLHLHKFQSLKECEVVGIYDSDLSRSKTLSEENKVGFFEKIEELIFESDAVVIASSSCTHYAIVKQALNAGLHVLVEKPLALNSKEAREIALLSVEKKVVLQVGFVERFRLRELSKCIHLSELRQIECERITQGVGREPGLDVVTDLMIHDLDLVLSLNLGKVKSVKARGTAVLNETLDVAVADLEFDSGVHVHLLANRLGPIASRKIRFLMDKSYCKMDLNHSVVTEVGKNGSKTYEIGKEKDFLLEQAKNFCEAIQSKTPPLVSSSQGIRSIELVEDILNALRTNPLFPISSAHASKEH